MSEATTRNDRSRQGPTGKPVLHVPIGGLVLLAGFFAVYMTWVGSSPPDGARVNAPGATTTSGLTTPTGGQQPHRPHQGSMGSGPATKPGATMLARPLRERGLNAKAVPSTLR